MKHPLTALFIFLPLLTAGRSLGQQCGTSTLGNINCGSGRATCFTQQEGYRGVVSCHCSATCLSPNAIQTTVNATRGFRWYAVGNAFPRALRAPTEAPAPRNSTMLSL